MRTKVTTAIAFTICLTLSALSRAESGPVKILSSRVLDYSATPYTLVIRGLNFGPAIPQVTWEQQMLDGAAMTGPDATNTYTLTVTIPGSVAPGDHLLRVSRPHAGSDDGNSDTFVVTLGAMGAAGSAGPSGANGKDGTNGVDGVNGKDGSSVTVTGSFSGAAHGCPNGGVILSSAAGDAYLCNGADVVQSLLLREQAAVQAFDVVTGAGRQVGTVTGQISGTSVSTFGFAVTGPPAVDALSISYSGQLTITDLDGDQIAFANAGTGTFHLGVPGAGFQGTGGPIAGTSTVTTGTGKYLTWVGNTYDYHSVWTEPASGGLGNAYSELK
jgi:hypothetical protein